jgi:hypothetical protein
MKCAFAPLVYAATVEDCFMCAFIFKTFREKETAICTSYFREICQGKDADEQQLDIVFALEQNQRRRNSWLTGKFLNFLLGISRV